jgi:hypothetical protein
MRKILKELKGKAITIVIDETGDRKKGKKTDSENRYIREIIYGKKGAVTYWETTTEPETMPPNSTSFVQTNLKGKLKKIGFYRSDYAELTFKCQQIKQRNVKFSKFLKPYPNRLITFNRLLIPSTAPLVVRLSKYPVISPNQRLIVPTLFAKFVSASTSQSSNLNVPSDQFCAISKIFLKASFC